MKIHAPWATPLVIGSFLLSAVTGILMFFHIDSGLNKLAHEWLSWLLVAGVALHVLTHLPSFKRYFTQPRARWVMGGLAVVLVASFIRPPAGGGGGNEPPQAVLLRTLVAAPVPALAAVAGVEVQHMRQRMAEAGLQVTHDQQSVKELVGPDRRRQMQVLAQLVAPKAAAAPRQPA